MGDDLLEVVFGNKCGIMEGEILESCLGKEHNCILGGGWYGSVNSNLSFVDISSMSKVVYASSSA